MFVCECCHYSSCNKNNFEKHLSNKKHEKNIKIYNENSLTHTDTMKETTETVVNTLQEAENDSENDSKNDSKNDHVNNSEKKTNRDDPNSIVFQTEIMNKAKFLMNDVYEIKKRARI